MKHARPGTRSRPPYYIRLQRLGLSHLTFSFPHGDNKPTLHAEYDGGDDDGGQGGLGYEGGVGHEEGQAEEDEEAGVQTSHGRPHSAGGVHCGPTEGARDGHGLDKAARQVTEAQSQHLL